jgi:hypothetical protein
LTSSWTFFQRAKTAPSAIRYDVLAPRTFVVLFAFAAMTPLMPTLPAFANHAVSS